MKIYSINPNEIPKARVGEVAETLPSRKESISPQRTEPTMNPSTFRSYAEALVIAHTARSIIAKAVEAASQLQGLAARTLTGESVDRSEVLKAVSTINAIISEATNQPKVAVITVPLNATSHTINFSQIVESAEKLRQQTVRFEEGMKPNAEEIVRIQEEFHTVRTEVETAYNSVRLQRGNFTDIDDGETARSIFEKTVEAINVQPHGALAVQGNVFPSRADELVG